MNIVRKMILWSLSGVMLLGGSAKMFADEVQEEIDHLKDRNPDVRESAIIALGHSGDVRAVEPLIKCLNQDHSNSVRSLVADALGQLQDRRAVNPLIACLKDQGEDKLVQSYAADALGKIGDPRAVEQLITSLADSDLRVRISASQSLGRLHDSRAVEPLIACLKDTNSSMGDFAAFALGLLKEPSVKPLLACLEDQNSETRRFAANAFITMGDENESNVTQYAIIEIVNALPNWDARREFGEVLKHLGWTPKTDAEQVYLWICIDDQASLIKNWQKTAQVLLIDAKTGDPQKIKNAVCTFVQLGNKDVFPELIEILNTDGTGAMAKIYIDSGNQTLMKAGKNWINSHGP